MNKEEMQQVLVWCWAYLPENAT